MAATAEVKTFWAALLSVLIKCIAALGFTTTAARVATRTATQAQAPVADRTNAAAGTTVRGRAICRVPGPRGCEPVRRERERTLPPTMKQRISAESHGSSPSARSIRAGELEDITAGLALAGAAAGSGTTTEPAGS